MHWYEILTIIGANAVLFLWNRSEANVDRREMRAEMKSFHEAIKDFHGRLVSLEERYQIQRGKR